MSEWASIPIHLRLTERWKIDPNYPNDTAKWWQLEEKKTRVGAPGASNSGQSERQQAMLALIEEKGEITQADIRDRFGYPCELSKHIINGLSHRYPIYEGKRGGFSYYGVVRQDNAFTNN